jgi:enoyl-CoA hydratase
MPSVSRANRLGVATLTMSRSPINALDRETLEMLDRAIGDLERDHTVRVVVLASGIDGVFCAGGDLRFWRRYPRDRAREVSRAGRQVFTHLRRLPVPVLAAIEGHVIGDGLALALSADLRIASERASFRLPEADYGFIPGWGVPHLLEQAVGRPRALELLLTGSLVDAEQALFVGLVHRVVPAGQALVAAGELAGLISRKSPRALAWSKRVLIDAPDTRDRGPWEEECFAQVWGAEDWQAGVEALLAGRAPDFGPLRSEG